MPVATAHDDPPAERPGRSIVLQRLVSHSTGDRVVQKVLAPGYLRTGLLATRTTSLDAAACTLTRTLLQHDTNKLALAFPRGRGPHPALLGLTLVLWRHVLPRVSGSVLVSTSRGELSKTLKCLMFDGSMFENLTVGRLVTENVPGTGGTDMRGNVHPPRKRPAIRPLDRGPRRGLSQADGFLLFGRPNTLPPLPANVISSMVVDTVGTAGPNQFARPDAEPDSWTRTWDLNTDAGRRNQLWLGELDDPDFERFCETHSMPLVRFDWPLIEALAEVDSSSGAGQLTSRALVARAQRRPAVGVRVVEDAERDYLAREVFVLLAKMRRRGGDTGQPDVVKSAYKLCGLLCRLPCPTAAYEMAAGGSAFVESVDRLWNTVDNARASTFRGAKWKRAYNAYWDPIRSSLRKLVRLQADENTCGKYEALLERIGQAQVDGEKLRVMCQTNAERSAVKATLADYGVDSDTVTVHSFGARFEYGTDAKVVTLLVATPPPWKASILTTGEAGRVEVLCYPHEVARLRTAVTKAERSREAENLAALDALRLGTGTGPQMEAAVVEKLENLPGYAVGDGKEPESEFSHEVPPADSTLWQELLLQQGQELPDAPAPDDDVEFSGVAASASPYDGVARLVRFSDAPPVFFRGDAVLDVLSAESGEDKEMTEAVPVAELEEGMTIAFLPGGHRSIMDGLLAAYDERLSLEAKMFEPLWRRALASAVERHGVAGLAAITERTSSTVNTWLRGRNVPQQDWRFKRLIEASGDQEAIQAQTPLWTYLTATRGPHRHIGRLNRLAIYEAAGEERNQTHLRDLEVYVGRDLEDLYDQVEPVTVISVSEPVEVPLSHCGHYLPDNDPYLRRHA